MAMLALVVLCVVSSALALPLGDSNPRIVGGSAAGQAQYPHQVSLRRNNNHFCGGSILNGNTILTAAHCVYGESPNGVTVVVGTNTLNAGGIAHAAVSLIAHPQYNPQTTVNDVAIVKIASTIQFNNAVRAVSLASSNPSSGQSLILSGWGLIRYPGGAESIPNALQHIGLTNIDLNTCAQRLAGTNPITTGHVCTSSPAGQGACQGDSGGPLITTSGVQVGVVSWGVPCAKGLPDVFTSVAFYRSWIQSNM